MKQLHVFVIDDEPRILKFLKLRLKASGYKVLTADNIFEAPNITWAELIGQHENHALYTEATIKDAITKGLEPNDKDLEIYMPRW